MPERADRKKPDSKTKHIYSFADTLPQVVYEMDLLGNLIFVNKAGIELFGYTEEEFSKGVNAFELMVPEDRERAQQNAVDVVHGEGKQGNEYTALRRDGSEFPVIIYSTPVIRDGKPEGLTGVIVDISLRKRSEELLASLNAVSLKISQYTSKDDIFRVMAEELSHFGFTSAILIIDSETGNVHFDYITSDSKLIKMAEKLTGLKQTNFSFPISQVDVYNKVYSERTTELVESSEVILKQMLPRGMGKFIKPILKLFSLKQTISAPLIADDKVFGLFTVQSGTLTDDDIPAITAFANQVASQWHKAELLESMRNEVEEKNQAESDLRNSEERLKVLFESAPDAIFLTDLKGVFLDGNRAAENMIGYDREELVGKNFFKLKILSPADLLKAGKVIALNTMGKQTSGEEFSLNTKSGEKVSVEISAFPLTLQNKKVILGIARDITSRISSEKLLRESEERFRRMAESLEDGLTIIEKGKRVFINERLSNITGFSRKELLDLTWVELATSEEKERVEDAYAGIEKGENIPEKFEFWITAKKGKRRCIQNVCSVKEWKKGAVDLYIITTDITDQKLAERALLESEEKYKRLIENAKETIFIIQDGLIQYCNPNSLDISGYSEEELTSIPFPDFVFPEDRDLVIGHHMARLKGEESEEEYSFRIIKKNGDVRWVEIRAVLIEWEDRPATLTFMTDITERKNAEDLLRAQRDLALAISGGGDYEEVLLGCLKGLLALPGLDAGGIYLQNPDKAVFELVCHAGLSIDFVDQHREFPGESERAKLILNGDPVYGKYAKIRKSKLGKNLNEPEKEEQLKALGIIPIRHDGYVIGCINVASHSLDEIGGDVQKILESMIPHLGLIIGKAKTERALKESEGKFRNIVQSSPMGIHLYELMPDDTLVLTGSNPAADGILGIENAYFFGRTMEEIFPALKDSEVIERYKKTASEGVAWFSEHVDFTSGTVEGAFEVNVFQTGPRRIAAMFLDITHRKKAEKTLKESEKRFRSLIEDSPVGTSIIQGTSVLYRNKAQEVLKDPVVQMVETGDYSLVYQEDIQTVHEFFSKLSRGESVTENIEFRFYTNEKKEESDLCWVSCGAGEFEYEGETSILLTMMDVTQIRKLEYVVRVQEKLTSLGRVAAGIAHEIRNPLSGINIYLDTLRTICSGGQEINTEKGLHILDQIEKASGKIESVIKRVMDFSKPGTAKLTKGDINKPVREAVQLSAVTVRKMDVTIIDELGEDLPNVRFDMTLIEEVVLNLIYNAAQAMKESEEKKIRVTTGEGDNVIFIKVEDTGPGVPIEKREQLFEPFFTTKNDSTGIGLSICRRVIADHRGTLEVGDSEMGGAEFIIELPLRRVNKND